MKTLKKSILGIYNQLKDSEWLSEFDKKFLKELLQYVDIESGSLNCTNIEKFKQILAGRWRHSQGNVSSYLNDSFSPINQLCIALSKLSLDKNAQLSKKQNFSTWLIEGGKHYELLMPGIEWQSYDDIDDYCYYQSQPLSNLCLRDDAKNLIVRTDAINSSELDENNILQMKHQEYNNQNKVDLTDSEKERVYFKASKLDIVPNVSSEGKKFIGDLKTCFKRMRSQDKYHQWGRSEEEAEFKTTEIAENHRLNFWEKTWEKYFNNDQVRAKLSEIKVHGIIANNLGYKNLVDMLDIYTTGYKKGSDKQFTRCLDTLATSIESIIDTNIDQLKACFPEDKNATKSRFTKALPSWKINSVKKIDSAEKHPDSMFQSLKQELHNIDCLIVNDLPESEKNKANKILGDLKSLTKNFFESPLTSKGIENYQDDFSKKLKEADGCLSKHTARWKPILANILIGCTLIGLVAIGIKMKIAYNGAVQGKNDFNFNNCLFFGKTKSERVAEKTKDIVTNLNRYIKPK